MADMTVTAIPAAGLADLATSAVSFTSGDKFVNRGRRTMLFVANGSGSTRTITIPAQKTSVVANGFGAVTKGNIVCSILAGDNALIGPFESCYEDVNKKITVNADSVTSVTAVPIYLPEVSA